VPGIMDEAASQHCCQARSAGSPKKQLDRTVTMYTIPQPPLAQTHMRAP